MTGGSGDTSEQFMVDIKINPVIIHVIELLGTGQNLEEKLTNILNAVVTNRLLKLYTRVLNTKEANIFQVSKGIVETQQQLQVLQGLFLSDISSYTKKSRRDQEKSEFKLNATQFIGIFKLEDPSDLTLEQVLIDLLLEEGKARVNQLNAQLAKELVEQGIVSGTSTPSNALGSKNIIEDINPTLLLQKELLRILKTLAEVKEQLDAPAKRRSIIESRIKSFADICAAILKKSPEEIVVETEKLLQKLIPTPSRLSFEILYDQFKDNFPEFDELAKKVSLKREQPTKPLEPSIIKSPKKVVKPRSKNTHIEHSPTLKISPPSKISEEFIPKNLRSEPSDTRDVIRRSLTVKLPKSSPVKITEQTILESLTSELLDIRDLLTIMGINNMADARYLQILLRTLETSDKLIVEIKEGKKLYRKKING